MSKEIVGKVLDIAAELMSKYPNAITLAASGAIYLVRGVGKAIGMSEEQAMQEWRSELKKLEERPDLPMNFDI